MSDRATGSQDDHPPRIIAGSEYEFVAIAQHDGHYELVTSKQSQTVSKTYVVARLRDIADRIEATK